MRWQPFPLVGGSHADDSRPWSSQDTINLIPEVAERGGARAQAVLKSVPGLRDVCATQNAPVRGLHDVEGATFAAVGRTLYRIQPDAAVSLGTIPGVGAVSMAHNQISGGSEVVIASRSTAYVWNTVTSTLAQITDEGFPGAKVVDFLDGYIMFVEPMGRFWGHSDLADATSYNTLDRSEAEAQPDRIVTGIVTHGDWLVFGARTGEFFYNTGEATGTFQRRDGTEMEVGCAGTHAVVRLDNTVFWLGHDGCFYRLEGYNPVRISTHAIEQAIARESWPECRAMVMEDRGHKVAYWSFPNGITVGFDVATQEWHRRQSKDMAGWRVSALAKSRTTIYAGDARDGTIYALDWSTCTEKGEPLDCRRRAGGFHDDGNRLTVNAVKLVIDTGKP